MIRHTRTALKWLVYGLIIGILFAPAPGKQTRKDILKWATDSAGEAVKSVTGSK